MEVVIGEGRSETIEVHIGDEPQTLAMQFASKHALKPDAIPKLTQLIQGQLDELNQDDAGFVEEDKAATTSAIPEQQQLSERQYHEPGLAPGPTCMPSFQHDDDRLTPSFTDMATQYSLSIPHQEAAVSDHETGMSNSSFAGAEAWDKQEREYSRAMNYHNLIAKYGHYSQHSGKVNPQQGVDARTSSSRRNELGDATRDAANSRDTLTFRNIQLAEHARVTISERHHATIPTSSRRHTLHSSTNKYHKGKAAAPAVFDRLYALAESKDKWIKRAQTAKQRELEREQDQRKVEMAAKSRELVAHRQHSGNGGYAHIGERLYEEALSDMAKKDKLREQRAVEREHQIDWMCPKCTFVNQFHDDVCKNIVAAPATSGEDSRPISRTRRESVGGGMTMMLAETSPDVICGQQKPEQLFRPTLMATSSTVAKAAALNKERATSIASTRREKNQQAMEQKFRQTCPFKPKINEVSEEIVRERLENEARVATTVTATGELRRKDPHLALYEESFHVRANRQAREEEYMRQYSFKPDIGVNSLWISEDRSKDDLVERLAVSKYQEMEQKRLALHEKYAPDRDPHSGRAFFKPETGRAPIFNRNEKGLPIGEFLHESHREQQEYHRRLLQQSMQEIHEQSHQGFVSESSRQALARRKQKTFSRIFDALLRVSTDPPACAREGGQPGVGSFPQGPSKEETPAASTVSSVPEINTTEELVVPTNVDIQKLPHEIAHVVPIVFEFANHEPFDREQFAGFMEKLMTEVPGLTYTQVLFLAENLNDGKSSRSSRADDKNQQRDQDDDEEQLTFHPTIDKNSGIIAKKHGRADRSKVFQALSQYFEHYKNRKEQIKKQQQREFERLHPFQPTFVSKHRKQQANEFYSKIKRTGEKQEEKQEEQLEGADRLSTAIANARPCVRPIENDRIGHRIITTKEISSSRCSTPQPVGEQSQQPGSDEDADLTSRVLAALDELPAASGSLSSSSQSFSYCASTVSGQEDIRNAKLLLSPQDSERLAQLRSPEQAT
uniref:PFU domain-containing protein n=1 Tax=Globisporangium ultimum (strain ATCC 200006 / CBS 805.95 / DAOM BR144) TaxID=431595 RepID=K3WPU9_GLOUD